MKRKEKFNFLIRSNFTFKITLLALIIWSTLSPKIYADCPGISISGSDRTCINPAIGRFYFSEFTWANIVEWEVTGGYIVPPNVTTGNLTGVFSINPSTGTVYYGVQSNSSFPTVGSGTFKIAEIYQARLVASVWTIIKTTNGLNFEGSDNYIYGPVFNGNHLFYVGAGGSATTGSQKELEVWNLFYESACNPSVFKKGLFASNESSSTVSNNTETLSAYPNPFDQELNVNLGNIEGKITVELWNTAGQLVLSKTINGSATLTTSELTPGLYTAILKQNGVVIKREKLARK